MAHEQGRDVTEEHVVPVVAEELEVETRQVVRGTVHIDKRVETRDEVVNLPVVHEEVVVERVPMNTLVEGAPPAVREEDDVLVIPYWKKSSWSKDGSCCVRSFGHEAPHDTQAPQTVTLRREVVDVERVDGESQPKQGETP